MQTELNSPPIFPKWACKLYCNIVDSHQSFFENIISPPSSSTLSFSSEPCCSILPCSRGHLRSVSCPDRWAVRAVGKWCVAHWRAVFSGWTKCEFCKKMWFGVCMHVKVVECAWSLAVWSVVIDTWRCFFLETKIVRSIWTKFYKFK